MVKSVLLSSAVAGELLEVRTTVTFVLLSFIMRCGVLAPLLFIGIVLPFTRTVNISTFGVVLLSLNTPSGISM